MIPALIAMFLIGLIPGAWAADQAVGCPEWVNNHRQARQR